MGSGKRASMREGPLADLFRKTAEDEEASQPRRPGEPAAERRPEERPKGGADEREGAPKQRKGEPSEGRRTEAEQPAPRALRRDDDEPRVPSPKERLSAAFSHDIPHDLLERPGDTSYRARDEPQIAPRAVRRPVLRVVGVGGAGVNAVNRMVEAGVEGVEFIAVNTDLQSLKESSAHVNLQIGDEITHGLGSGSDPAVGRAAAHADDDRIKSLLKGSDMVFVTAGAGGGTGTGAAPIVAGIARATGALTVGVVTKPFGFEGSRRAGQADDGVAELAKQVDTLIVIPNNRLLSVLDRGATMVHAFSVADDVLRQGVQGISDLVTLPGLINLDFADVRTIMTDAGQALLGIGMATGERRAVEAAEQAVSSPLLETSVDGARSILLSITGGRDLSLWEVNEAARAVSEAAHPGANIIFGAMIDEKIDDECWVTVVATGYGDRPTRRSGGRYVQEPAGEPRVRRGTEVPTVDIDVPEFVPGR
jgi:cell division protein FtsZ